MKEFENPYREKGFFDRFEIMSARKKLNIFISHFIA